jgi:ABC-2 type transport system permease protein
MTHVSALAGALRYEFRMQVRRTAVWVTIGLLSLMIFAIWLAIAGDSLHRHYSREQHIWIAPSQSDAILGWAQLLAMFLPVGVGLVLADRLARDRKIHVDEMLDSFPASPGYRLAGKWLGSTLATLTPVALIYAAVVVFILTQVPSWSGVGLAAAAFAAVLLPGMLFVAGFSVALPAVLRIPVYQFLFTSYWFWANLMSPKIGIPSIVGTMLNAAGPWAQEGIFNFGWNFLQLHATPAQGYLSIAILVGLGLLAVLLMGVYLRWQAAVR